MKQTNKSTKKEVPKPAMPQPKLQESGELIKTNRKLRITDKENEVIKSKRPGLIKKGLTDWSVARELTKEPEFQDRTVRSIDDQIRSLVKIGVKEGGLEENPNKEEKIVFTEEENVVIKSKRPELIRKRLRDSRIARELAKAPGLRSRSAKSIRHQIERLVRKGIKEGGLEENPNKKIDFTEQQNTVIKSKRSVLIEKGLTDWAISRELTKEPELQIRSSESIAQQIGKLVRKGIKEGGLNKNPNKEEQIVFTEEEHAVIKSVIKSKRPELIRKGLTDWRIAIELTNEPEFKRTSAKSIDYQIRSLVKIGVKEGGLEENPNKIVRSTMEDAESQIEALLSRLEPQAKQ